MCLLQLFNSRLSFLFKQMHLTKLENPLCSSPHEPRVLIVQLGTCQLLQPSRCGYVLCVFVYVSLCRSVHSILYPGPSCFASAAAPSAKGCYFRPRRPLTRWSLRDSILLRWKPMLGALICWFFHHSIFGCASFVCSMFLAVITLTLVFIWLPTFVYRHF